MRIFLAILISSFWLLNDAVAQRSVIDHMRLADNVNDSAISYTFSIPENEDYDYFVGAFSGPVSYLQDVLSNELFYERNDSLFTKYSFDYEGILGTQFAVVVSTTSGLDTAMINITDVTGKWDTDGIADAAIAAKYTNVNQGDYIAWNYSKGNNLNIAPTGLGPANKILIHGKVYHQMTIDMSGSQGLDSTNKLVITNFLGQVQSTGGIDLQNPTYVRLTGQYDSINGYGHRYFVGCEKDSSSVSFSYSHGTYGIYTNNQWQAENSGYGVLINTDNTGVEIDHLEIANGGANGIKMAWPNNFSVSTDNYIHHNFIHDIGAEGLLLGQPQGYPQQVFQNTYVENNAFVRCGGEGIQATWIMHGSKIRNNFIHSALDWKSPFARWQDGVLQISSLGGGIDVANNVLMGGGNVVSDISTRNNVTPLSYPSDILKFTNNLVYYNRSDNAFYCHSTSDGKTKLTFDGNVFGKLGYDLDKVYPNADTTSTTAMGLNNTSVAIQVKNNLYDFGIENLTAGAASPLLSNNQKTLIQRPDFENYLGQPGGYNYLKVSRYTDYIGTENNFPNNGTNKGDPASWEVGDIVQWWNNNGETRFYQCKLATSSGTNTPPQDDSNSSHWKLLSWTKPNGKISYFPPDNIRLVSGSFYDQRGVGVRDILPNSPPPPPPPAPNIPPTVSIDQPLDGDSLAVGSSVNLQASASDMDGAVFSVRFKLDGQTLKTDYLSPFTATFQANSLGTFTLEATAYDSDGDSTTSAPVEIYVYNPNHFLVLNYTETSSYDHGTATASQNMLQNIGNQEGFTVHQDSTGNSFNNLTNLRKYEVVIFSNTTGNALLDSNQRAVFENYINNGGTFIGIHAASDAYRHSSANGTGTGQWDWYAQMLGASVQHSPNHTAASYSGILDHIGTHTTTANVPNPWNKTDEYYYWENGYYDSTNIPVLEVRATGGQSYDSARAVAWYKYLPGGGRSFYTALGHSNSDFNSDNNFRNHIRDAIIWGVTNQLPSVEITSVSAQDTVVKDSVMTLTAMASDPDGTVDSVGFHINNNLIDMVYTAPWSTSYKAKSSGNHNLKAIAYDNDGGSTTSNTVSFFVEDTISGDTIILAGNTINENYPAGTYIGTLSGSSSYRVNHEVYDGWFFMIQGDSLLSRMAFNYDAFIGSNVSNSHPKVQIESAAGNKKVFTITINPASGKYDNNGYADQDIVDKYEALGDSSLRVGDYLVFNWSNKIGDYFGDYPNVSYPNQIKIMSGWWRKIAINLDNAVGNNTKQPIIITNWLGQLEYREKLSLNKCNACRLTGEYDPVKKTGNKHFDVSIHEPYKYRRFGIFRDAKSIQNNSAIATLGTGMTKIQIDHVELMGGGYDGLNFKDDNAGGGLVDSCRVYSNYLHDLKNEGIYMGNTKSIASHGPQQHYTNVLVKNNIIVRCGSEGYQFQRGIGNNVYRNNVIWSGLVWLNPFQNNQFANEQWAWTNGGHTGRDNIFMGGVGDNSTLIKPRPNEVSPYSQFTNSIRNSLYWALRGNGGFYMNGNGTGSNFAPTTLDSIYIGNTRNNYNVINSQWDPKRSTNAVFIESWDSPIKIGYLFYDSTVTNPTNGHTKAKNPVQQTIPAPQFENPLGTLALDPTKWQRWFPVIWANTTGSPASQGFNVGDHWHPQVGDIIQHWVPVNDRWQGTAHPVRLFRCIQTHDATNIEPGVTPGWENYWELLTWTKPDGTETYYPPDDFDLVQGSYYDTRGMGLD